MNLALNYRAGEKTSFSLEEDSAQEKKSYIKINQICLCIHNSWLDWLNFYSFLFFCNLQIFSSTSAMEWNLFIFLFMVSGPIS